MEDSDHKVPKTEMSNCEDAPPVNKRDRMFAVSVPEPGGRCVKLKVMCHAVLNSSVFVLKRGDVSIGTKACLAEKSKAVQIFGGAAKDLTMVGKS